MRDLLTAAADPSALRAGLGVVLGSALIAATLAALLWWIVGHVITLAH